MPTDAEVNAQLHGGARIIQSLRTNGVASYYVSGGVLAPGRCRWIDCPTSDSAAVQAAAIEAGLGG